MIQITGSSSSRSYKKSSFGRPLQWPIKWPQVHCIYIAVLKIGARSFSENDQVQEIIYNHD